MTGSPALFEPPSSVRGNSVLIVLWFRSLQCHWGIIEGKAFSGPNRSGRTLFLPSLQQRHFARKTARKRCKTRQCRVGSASIVADAISFASTDRQRAPKDSAWKRAALSPSGQR